jgi:hypothetical protein
VFHVLFIVYILQVIEDIYGSLQPEEAEPPTRLGHYSADCDDLWSPKKIQPYVFPVTCGKNILYNTL